MISKLKNKREVFLQVNIDNDKNNKNVKKTKDEKSELKTFCWEGVLQTPSISFTPYSTFIKAYKRCDKKTNKSLGLSLIRNSNEFYQVRDQILNY